MQVRVRTEAPPPHVREQTDQPLQEAHSFLKKCSCRRARPTRRPRVGGAPVEPHADTHED